MPGADLKQVVKALERAMRDKILELKNVMETLTAYRRS